MKCPACGSDKSRVQGTVRLKDMILRYRGCIDCGATYQTKETLQIQPNRVKLTARA